MRGYSIGQWADEDGDGKYDVLQVETRFLKNPRSYDISGIPFDSDNQTIMERIYLDNANANTLYDQITVFDHSPTRPYSKTRKAIRNPNPRPVWFANVCSEDNIHVSIEHQQYYRSADGKLMPPRRTRRRRI